MSHDMIPYKLISDCNHHQDVLVQQHIMQKDYFLSRHARKEYDRTKNSKKSTDSYIKDLQHLIDSFFEDVKISKDSLSNELHRSIGALSESLHVSRQFHFESLTRHIDYHYECLQRSLEHRYESLKRSIDFYFDDLQMSLEEDSFPSENSTGFMSTPSESVKSFISVLKEAIHFLLVQLSTAIMAVLVASKYSHALLLAVFISGATCGEIRLECDEEIALTSPQYPSNYPPRAYREWYIKAPPNRRILVSFHDFSSKDQKDVLELSDETDIQNRMEYTGEEKQFPPFLTRGNSLQIIFTFRGIGTRRGFNITVSCFQKSDTTEGRLVGGTSPLKGFLNVPTKSGKLARVCKEGFTQQVAEVVCGELGYPGAKEVIYDTKGCHPDTYLEECAWAPSCKGGTYRLEDCAATNNTCTSSTAVKIKCFEPGYRGCYTLTEMPQTGSTFTSTAQCVSLCRGGSTDMTKSIAIMNATKCFCSTAEEVNLSNLIPLDQVTCYQQGNSTGQKLQNLNVIYNVSVGFCELPADVVNGFWDSNITWFGSIVHLKCDDGYSLNGSGALQCVPGVSPYDPVWNGSVPSCELEGIMEPTSDDPKSVEDPTKGWHGTVVCIIIIIVVLFLAIAYLMKEKYRGSRCMPCWKRKEETCKCKSIKSTWNNFERFINQLGIKSQPAATGAKSRV